MSDQIKYCERCGIPLRKDSQYEICESNKACAALKAKLKHARKKNEIKLCEICNGPLNSNALYGVCSKTIQCRRERNRRQGQLLRVTNDWAGRARHIKAFK